MESQDRRPRQRSFFARLRRRINGPGAGIPNRALHPPLAGDVMRAKIREPLGSYLEARDFKKAEEQWTWIRPRTAWVNDYIFAPLLTKSAPELYGINLYVGVQCPPVNRLLVEVSGGRYKPTRPLLSPLISEPYLHKKRIPSRWDFWNTAFDDEEMDDMLWHLECYGLPFMESFNALDDLVAAFYQYAPLFQDWPEKAAAILALAGRYDEAQRRLEGSLRTVKAMSEEQIKIINTMIDALQDKTLQGLVADRIKGSE